MPHPPRPNRKDKHNPTPLWTTVILLAAIVAAICLTLYLRQKPAPTGTVTPKHPIPTIAPSAKKHLVTPKPPALPTPKIAKKTSTAKFVLVIDDMGYHKKVGDALLNLPLDLTFAFLPFAPHTESQLKRAQKQGRDILLHLPMEATDKKWNPGPGALTVSMSQEELQRTVLRDLAAIPNAIGINNHMGSKFTENEPAMRDFLHLLKERNLFFLDSQTSPNSVGSKVASQLGVLTMRRNVFLDNQQDKDIIKKQLDTLVFLAKKQGIAIGIAHPHQATLDALRDYQLNHDKSVTMVSIRELLENKTTRAQNTRKP